MHINMNYLAKINRISLLARGVVAAWVGLLLSPAAHAVPAYARQTGENCIACHVSFPELTPFGRYFKLTGYTLANQKTIPLSAMVQISQTSTKNTTGSGPDTFDFQRDGGVAVQQVSLFYAGRISDHAGAFSQWTYDGLGHHSALDNTDIRYANKPNEGSLDLVYGVTLHNNPTVQDAWNSTPAFGYPYAAPANSSSAPGPAPAVAPLASSLIEGGLAQQVAGLGSYVFWKKTLYAEVSLYRTADQGFSLLRAGQDTATSGGVKALKGYNPYGRLAYNREWGANSLMLGTYGLVAQVYPDNINPTGPTDRFKDLGLDAQYQYITDPHTFTTQINWIHEKQEWSASGPSGLGNTANTSDVLKTLRAKATYYYRRKYGATLAYFTITGDTDAGLYPTLDGNGNTIVFTGSANHSPNTNGYIMEFDYLLQQNIKFTVQYTAYQKFNGAHNNYDGNGRNASDNNTLYLLAWLMF